MGALRVELDLSDFLKVRFDRRPDENVALKASVVRVVARQDLQVLCA